MLYLINGFKDIHTVLSNERKLGGAIEADFIRLRTGEEYKNVAVTHIDAAGSILYSISFVAEDGNRYMVHVNEISMISQPTHKHVKDLKNIAYKKLKIDEKIKFLKKLCSLNEGFYTKTFVEEVARVILDIGLETAKERVGVDLDRFADDEKVISLRKRVS